MKSDRIAVFLVATFLGVARAFAAPPPATPVAGVASAPEGLVQKLSTPLTSTTTGTVTVGGQAIHYRAVAGTLVLDGTGIRESTPEVAMSYVAYFKQGANTSQRPVTFIYNGGPGSASLWLLMGAWGPERVVTNDHTHTPAAPYRIVDNEYSLLDASDLVFIDMPGTGFGRLLPRGSTEATRAADQKRIARKIWNVDGDAEAYARFIQQFLSRFGRWNSPKYLYGESYGTTRSAMLARILELQDNIDLNGVILQSQILNFNFAIDGPSPNPGAILPYVLALPTYAATAWYHGRLPKYDRGGLEPLLTKVIRFAKTDYEQALFAGSTLSAARKAAVARRLQEFTGLPAAYWMKADLLVNAEMFQHELLGARDETVGQLDTRFAGPSMDPMGEKAEYDPQSAAISSAYVSAFNEYVRNTLKFGRGMVYRPMIYGLKGFHFSMHHRAPGGTRFGNGGGLDVMGDLAAAMKYNPDLKVMMNGGFYDLSTPFYTAIYEDQHLPIPAWLEKNITYAFYPSGHMLYVHVPALRQLHANVVKFIRDTEGGNHGARAATAHAGS